MARLVIEGPARIEGAVEVAGAKNAALPLLAASLLCERPFRLENVPWVTDVAVMVRLLRSLGTYSRWLGPRVLELAPASSVPPAPAPEEARRIRASFCLLGPMLARFGHVRLPMPGGCRIGPRPVDLHLTAMRRLGAELRVQDGWVEARANRLRPAILHLASRRGPSVTGTCNAMMAAVGAEGETVIYGAACEPEVVALGRFLQRCGVRIEGLGTPTVRVFGTPLPLRPPLATRIIPDRIEAATWLCAAAATGGSVEVRRVRPDHLEAPMRLLQRIGCRITLRRDRIRLRAPERLNAFIAVARPYPHIATDLQAQLTAVATAAAGESEIRDLVFPTRWQHVPQLRRLGARLRQQGERCFVLGPCELRGAAVEAVDLRASAALVIAAIRADGETVIEGVEELQRGYEDMPQKLRGLGVTVTLHDERLERRAA